MTIQHTAFCRIYKSIQYVPFVSTGIGLYILFQKLVFIPQMDRRAVAASHCYSALSEVSIARCFIICIPVLGNIAIALYDRFGQKPSGEKIKQNPISPAPQKETFDSWLQRYRGASPTERKPILEKFPPELRCDSVTMLKFFKINPDDAFLLLSDQLKTDPRFMIQAANGSLPAFDVVMKKGPSDLKKNPNFSINALKNGATWDQIDTSLKENRYFSLIGSMSMGNNPGHQLLRFLNSSEKSALRKGALRSHS